MHLEIMHNKKELREKVYCFCSVETRTECKTRKANYCRTACFYDLEKAFENLEKQNIALGIPRKD